MADMVAIVSYFAFLLGFGVIVANMMKKVKMLIARTASSTRLWRCSRTPASRSCPQQPSLIPGRTNADWYEDYLSMVARVQPRVEEPKIHAAMHEAEMCSTTDAPSWQ